MAYITRFYHFGVDDIYMTVCGLRSAQWHASIQQMHDEDSHSRLAAVPMAMAQITEIQRIQLYVYYLE